MNQLGVNNRGDMNLRMEYSTFGNRTPQRDVLGCGAPPFDIPKSVLAYHLHEGLKIKDIASMLSVSECAVYRRMRSYGLGAHDFSDICDDEVDRHLSELSKEFVSNNCILKLQQHDHPQPLVGRKGEFCFKDTGTQ